MFNLFMMEQDKAVYIISSDKKELVTCEKAVHVCGTLKNFLQDMEVNMDKIIISLPETDFLKEEFLLPVIEFSEHYKNEPVYTNEEREKNMQFVRGVKSLLVTEWDIQFIQKFPIDFLVKLMDTADYLECTRLMDHISYRCAQFIRNKSVQEIRDAFGIVNDFSPEEEKLIEEENAWAIDFNLEQ